MQKQKSVVAPDPRLYEAIRVAYRQSLADNPSAEECPYCAGLGAITLDVEPGHPAFGKTFPCPHQESSGAPDRDPIPWMVDAPEQLPDPAPFSPDSPLMSITVGQRLPWAYDKLTTELHGMVLGMTGSGKTNTIYVIVEEMLRAGGLVTILDPEGDYRFLKAQFPVLIAGKGRKGNLIDLPVEPGAACRFAGAVAGRGLSMVLDLSGFDEEAKNEFVAEYVGQLWREYQDEDLPPMRLVIDEVQLFAPQNTQTASKKLILDIASRGRKRHLALLVATQRPQRADKTLLDGMDIRIFHRLKRGTALNAVAELLPYQLGEVEGKEIKNLFAGMVRGQATFEMEGREATLVQIRPSDTYRPGSGAMAVTLPLATVDATLIEELRRVLAVSADSVVDTSPASADRLRELEADNRRLRDELSALREQLALKDAEVATLQAQIPPQQLQMFDQPTLQVVAESDGRSPLATARAVNKQNREFDAWLRSLGLLPGHHRAILKFLLEYEGTTYTLYELARYSGYSVSTIASNPPLKLINAGFIWRQTGRKHTYRSTARTTLEKLYPDLNTDGLIGQILKACK